MAVTIGAPAINRATSALTGYTILSIENPAAANGYMDYVDVWYDTSTTTDVKVGTFYSSGSNTYTVRDQANLGSVAAGSKQTFGGLDVIVAINDMIGVYNSTGKIERDDSGSGYWNVNADGFTAVRTYVNTANRTISAFGYSSDLIGGEIFKKWVVIR